MTKQQVLQIVKSNIAKADTPKALTELITFLEANRRYRSMGKIARLAQAKYEGAERDFNQGLVEKEDANLVYNSVNRTVLQLAEDLENDNFELSHYEPDMRPNEELTCPDFTENSEFNVLLLPFQPDKKDELTPHVTIKRRLANKAATENLNASIEIDKDYFEHHDTPGATEASEAGNDCGAQMVIWGIWEKLPTGTIISTDYKYLGFRDIILA